MTMRSRPLLLAAPVAVCLSMAAGPFVALHAGAVPPPVTVPFVYTGAAQTWTVPATVTQAAGGAPQVETRAAEEHGSKSFLPEVQVLTSRPDHATIAVNKPERLPRAARPLDPPRSRDNQRGQIAVTVRSSDHGR